MQIKVKRLNPEAKLPSYSHPGDAGMDIYALEETTLMPGNRAQIRTGISMELPIGFVALVWDKSGLSHKHGLKTLGGVIDAGYRGEYMIGMINLGSEPYTFEKGEKVAQILIQKIEHPSLLEVDELNDSSRGDQGFGSTGK